MPQPAEGLDAEVGAAQFAAAEQLRWQPGNADRAIFQHGEIREDAPAFGSWIRPAFWGRDILADPRLGIANLPKIYRDAIMIWNKGIHRAA